MKGDKDVNEDDSEDDRGQEDEITHHFEIMHKL